MVVVGLGYDLLFNSLLAHCVLPSLTVLQGPLDFQTLQWPCMVMYFSLMVVNLRHIVNEETGVREGGN